MTSWNPVLNLVVEMKRKYESISNDGSINLEKWIEVLNEEKYNSFFNTIEFNQTDELVIFRYGLKAGMSGLWDEENSIFRECRSVLIDLDKEELILTPFKKFFNLNEVRETRLDIVKEKIINSNKITVTNKLDGSMQSFRWYNNRLYMSGSRSFNPETSWRLAEGLSMLTESHMNMFKDLSDYTFIFEYISIKDAHVVKYEPKDEGMYLIGARSVVTGELLDYNELKYLNYVYGIEVVNQEFITLDKMLEKMKTEKACDKEGWILTIDDLMLKIKCDDYVELHTLYDEVSSPNTIIRHIANGTYDDLYAKLPENHKPRIQELADDVFEYISEMEYHISAWLHVSPKNDRKEFMIFVNKHAPKVILKYIIDKYLNKDYNVLKVGKEGYKKLNQIKNELEMVEYVR